MSGTIVRTSALQALQTELNVSFLGAINAPIPTCYQLVTSPIPASKKTVLLAIADLLPQMQEWVGDRKFNNPAIHSALVMNKHWELSMAVDADDLDDDETAQYILPAAGLGQRAAEHPDVLLGTLMQAAHAQLCFDGQNFFDTDHPIDIKNDVGAQSNYTSTGCALTAANWELVKARMASYRIGSGGGELLGVVPTHVMVPRQLEGIAKRIFTAEQVASIAGTATETNIHKGEAQIIVNDRLNNEPTAWYPMDLRNVLKPFVHVKRTPPKFVMMNQPNDEGRFLNNTIRFGVDGRWGIALGAWFRAYKAVA